MALSGCFPDNSAQDFAVALRRDRQSVLEIPRRKASFVRVIPQFDLALFQRLAIGRSGDREQYATPGAPWQQIPVDVEGSGMRRGLAPFQRVEPPRIVGEMHADMIGHEIQDEA